MTPRRPNTAGTPPPAPKRDEPGPRMPRWNRRGRDEPPQAAPLPATPGGGSSGGAVADIAD